MVKAVVESGTGAAAIPELMVKKELQLSTLRSIKIIDSKPSSNVYFEIIKPVLKLKHRQGFQTGITKAFEQILTEVAGNWQLVIGKVRTANLQYNTYCKNNLDTAQSHPTIFFSCGMGFEQRPKI